MTLKKVSMSCSRILFLVFAISSSGLLKISQAAVVQDGLLKINTITTIMTTIYLSTGFVFWCFGLTNNPNLQTIIYQFTFPFFCYFAGLKVNN